MAEAVRAALIRATALLQATSQSPRLDAEVLLAHACGVSREALLLTQLENEAPAGLEDLLARRMRHEPVAYITGVQEFWSLTLHVTPDVLIPRADSETLIEAAMVHFSKEAPKTILDLGTGSGALLLAALSEWPTATGIGVDASAAACAIASGNAQVLGFGDRCQIVQGDWAGGITGQFDLILCNPPYVEQNAHLMPDVRDYEPISALFAGPEGLDDYTQIAPHLARLIAPNGCAILEIGHMQGNAVTSLVQENGLFSRISKDLAGRDRCVVATH